MARTSMPVERGLGSGLDGLDEHGTVSGKIDEERRKNPKGNSRTLCSKTKRNRSKIGI